MLTSLFSLLFIYLCLFLCFCGLLPPPPHTLHISTIRHLIQQLIAGELDSKLLLLLLLLLNFCQQTVAADDYDFCRLWLLLLLLNLNFSTNVLARTLTLKAAQEEEVEVSSQKEGMTG